MNTLTDTITYATVDGLPARPITVLVAALGGEGGGVLADWIVAAATTAGYPVQSTSIPGVAQRTGATTYYVELYPAKRDALGARRPVLTLTPSPGNVDLMVASELLEAGRAMQNGFVTPERTTLVASTHRVYTVAEKMAMGDGRADTDRIVKAAGELAKRAVLFDMAELTARSGTVISAVMFGAMAGAGVLPLSRAECEAAIRHAGKGVEGSLKGFALGYAHATGEANAPSPADLKAWPREPGRARPRGLPRRDAPDPRGRRRARRPTIRTRRTRRSISIAWTDRKARPRRWRRRHRIQAHERDRPVPRAVDVLRGRDPGRRPQVPQIALRARAEGGAGEAGRAGAHRRVPEARRRGSRRRCCRRDSRSG